MATAARRSSATLPVKAHFADLWSRSLQQCIGTEVTDTDDWFYALAGVAEFMEEKSHYRASYGLWLVIFHDEVHWNLYAGPSNGAKSSNEGISSWSWLAASENDGILLSSEHPHAMDDAVVCEAKSTQSPPVTPFQRLSALDVQSAQSK